jgi:hypothetical protein
MSQASTSSSGFDDTDFGQYSCNMAALCGMISFTAQVTGMKIGFGVCMA